MKHHEAPPISSENARLPASLPRFETMIRRRLRRGARDYGDASFARPFTDLLDEIEGHRSPPGNVGHLLPEKLARLRSPAMLLDHKGRERCQL